MHLCLILSNQRKSRFYFPFNKPQSEKQQLYLLSENLKQKAALCPILQKQKEALSLSIKPKAKKQL